MNIVIAVMDIKFRIILPLLSTIETLAPFLIASMSTKGCPAEDIKISLNSSTFSTI